MSSGIGTRQTQRLYNGAGVNRRRASSRTLGRDVGKKQRIVGTISFTAPNLINDSGNGFSTAGFAVGMPLEILGSKLNGGEVVITAVAAGQLTVAAFGGGTSSPGPITTEGNAAQFEVRVEDLN